MFTSREGGVLNRHYYNRHVWKPALRAAGVEPTRENGMHALRHHYASVLLDGGVSIRVLADYLGHADPGFTLRIYAHLMPDTEERARAVIDASFRAPAESSRNDGPVGDGLASGGSSAREAFSLVERMGAALPPGSHA